MNESIGNIIKKTVDTIEYYIGYASGITGFSVFTICLIGIILAVVFYHITKSILSVVCSLLVCLLVTIVITQMGLI